MSNRLFAFLLSFAFAMAQPAISPPGVGAVIDSSGSLHAVIGLSGNFVFLDTGISNVRSASFSGSSGLLKTDTEILIVDAANQVTTRYPAPGGDPAVFAFDANGQPSFAYYSGTLLRFDGTEPISVTWTGAVVSLSTNGPDSATVILRRNDGLWSVQFWPATGDVQSESPILGISGPVLLRPNGDLLFTRDSNIVLRDANGVERTVAAAFQIDAFEQLGKDWIAVREAGPERIFALRITPDALDMYQLPEVSP
jgi:hypothetical protein